jgi:lycopene cyclase domain-containing protein
MSHYLYLICLVFVIICLLVIDWRFRLAFWLDRKRTLVTLSISSSIYIVWDLICIRFGIFFQGKSNFSLPYHLLPQFPIEELFFLFLLCYLTLILYRGGIKWHSRM